ncbi:MAG: MMPL family transporter [Candidatus Nanoarchaeia archaeon]|nr:MMPL family transporter [Candidatus Nanoarchaeia archaeon]
MKITEFYFKNQKKLTIIPLILIILSVIILTNSYIQTGDIMKKDVTLTGGATATIYTDKDTSNLIPELEKRFNTDFVFRKLTDFGSDKQKGFSIEGKVDSMEFKNAISEIMGLELTSENSSFEETGSSLGSSFYKQMIIAILFAFLFMGIVVFITFRNPIASLIVLFSGVFDMLVNLAIINLLGIRVSTAGISALLLIIGYGIDTDILLTTKVFKRREGSINERTLASIKTGLTMTATTMVALLFGYFLSSSFVIKEMFLIIMIGLIIDVIGTYSVNSYLINWYTRKKFKDE